jgi:hypothetical protein
MLQGGSNPRPGSRSGTNKQEHLPNRKYIERDRQVVKDQKGRVVGKREALGEPKPVMWSELPALLIYQVETIRRRSKLRISLKYHNPQRVPPDVSQARLRYPSLATCNVNVSSK